MRLINIAGRNIGPSFPAWIVAEIGGNHNQNFNEAVSLIHRAKECGADAIKVQTYTPDSLTVQSRQPEYMVAPNTPWSGQSLYEIYSKTAMPWEWLPQLKKEADEVGITIFSTVYDKASVDAVEEYLNPPCYKIAAPEIGDYDLIRYVNKKGKPVILTRGDAPFDDLDYVIQIADVPLAFLHYIPQYVGDGQAHLQSIPYMARRLDTLVGISNHCNSQAIPVAAVSMGAHIIEQHFCVHMKAIDASISMLPSELAAMVSNIRLIEANMTEGCHPQTLKRTAAGRCHVNKEKR